jgi:uncharacterized caspase-like protein
MDPHDSARRETLRRLAGLSLAQTLPTAAWGDAASLNALPRSALVLGNAAYRGVPQLANPVNDANAIAARLGEMRFQVASRTDASRGEMDAAIREYIDSLSKSRGVGLFYFAGHGFQMAWRNYLVPVDAALRDGEDVAGNTIDLTLVLEGIRRAGNPLNVVILDACRDNPFGGGARSGKGLSQVDAPVGTLLAYATSPGNTASDGDGANGLYTENLLREMRTPDAKIEDMFKRVRLNVRRASNGRQIPWESTSLEDDFYFVPPASIAKASQSELDRKYAEERELWQRAEATASAADRGGRTVAELDGSIAALEGYLQLYPSGHFAELAQVRLDRLLARRGEQRVMPIAPPTPFTQGTVPADLDWRVGDWYQVRVTDEFRRIERLERRRVTAVSDLQVVINNGVGIIDPAGNPIRDSEGRAYVDNQNFPNEFVVGKRWTTRFQVRTPAGDDAVTVSYVIKARERVTVAAGTFDAFRAEGSGFARGGGRREFEWWMAPDKVRMRLRMTSRAWDARNVPLRMEVQELLAFHEARHAAT